MRHPFYPSVKPLPACAATRDSPALYGGIEELSVAGAAGILLAVWLLDLLMGFMPALPEGIRIALDLQLDWRVVLYTIAVSTITGVFFGLAPALQSSKADVSTVLKDDSTIATGRYRKSRLRMSLVVAQVAFSLLLLISAGLVLRSLEKLRPTRLGFVSDNIVIAPVALEERDYDRRQGHEFYRSLSERVAALPGVENVSLVEGVPGGFMGGSVLFCSHAQHGMSRPLAQSPYPGWRFTLMQSTWRLLSAAFREGGPGPGLNRFAYVFGLRKIGR